MDNPPVDRLLAVRGVRGSQVDLAEAEDVIDSNIALWAFVAYSTVFVSYDHLDRARTFFSGMDADPEGAHLLGMLAALAVVAFGLIR